MKLLVAMTALVLLATEATALTRTARHIDDLGDSRTWKSSGGPCWIEYYNICSGWIWTWGGFPPEARIGKGFGPLQTCTDYGSGVETAWFLVFSPPPSGYGFTGTAAVELASTDHCPIAPTATLPFLPAASGWHAATFSTYAPRYLTLTLTLGNAPSNPMLLATDAPSHSAGCYPASGFGTRSFQFGTVSTPQCPGTPFLDQGLDAQLLWEFSGNIRPEGSIAVEAASWGAIKDLYR